MSIYFDLFWAFFIPNIVGYGGGPAIIPLIEAQVVGQYAWMDAGRFAETLALANALPSPVATKMAGYIGFEIAGIGGAFVAIFATVVPTLLIMIFALSILYKYRHSAKVKALSLWIFPIITALMALLSIKLINSGLPMGLPHFIGLFVVAGLALERFKIHPTWVICASLAYGAVFLS